MTFDFVRNRYCIEPNQTFSLPKLIRNRYCIETKPNQTICIATAGQEHILQRIQTKPFLLPQLVSNRYCTETKPNHFHCHSWSGTDIALKPNQTIFIAPAGQDRETSSDQKTSWTRTWFWLPSTTGTLPITLNIRESPEDVEYAPKRVKKLDYLH